MTEDRGLHRLGDAPEEAAHDHRRSDTEKVAQVGGVQTQQVAHLHVQFAVDLQDIDQNDDELDRAADQCRNGSAGNAQLGVSEVAVDEAVIETDVDADYADKVYASLLLFAANYEGIKNTSPYDEFSSNSTFMPI